MAKKVVTISFFVIILVLSVVGNVYLFQRLSTAEANPQQEAVQEVADLVETVGKLIVLPADETPTVATVSDIEKLKDQEFFKNAQVGDKVLLYTKAKRAILYSPTSGKIVEVAPINIGENTGATNVETPAETNTSAETTPTTP
ncbi:MAG: hypothetical protein WC702_00010 [Patescibacteria group bacterium]|jgi:hypothetical protein